MKPSRRTVRAEQQKYVNKHDESNTTPRLRILCGLLAAVVWGGVHVPAYAQTDGFPPAAGDVSAQSAATTPEATRGAETVQFNTGFLREGTAADVSALIRGNGVVPGVHKVDVMLNGMPAGSHEIEFKRIGDQWNVQPCITEPLLDLLHIDFRAAAVAGRDRKPGAAPDTAKTRTDGVGAVAVDDKAMQLTQAKRDGDAAQPSDGATVRDDAQSGDAAPAACVDLAAIMQGASVDYDPGMLTLKLSVPQAFVRSSPRGLVDRSRWDSGINAAYTNYYASANHSTYSGGDGRDSFYLGLNNGINVGGWRLRNESSISQDSGFQSSRTYAQHDITAWNSQFTAGGSYTPSDMFDSIRFRGVQIATDDAMLPDSMREYAPVVRGVTDSNATIEIRQNGYVLYQTVVPPGPFEINDLYPSGSSGDLEVTIIEADGRRRVFRQPFASVPIMVRKGGLRYSFTTGQYDSGFTSEHPVFAQATVIKGLTDTTTIYGGALMSPNYQSVVGGVGVNTPIGAVSVDLSHAHAHAPTGEDEKGQSLRFLFARTFTSTGTNFTLAGYRYSTRGYRTFAESLNDTTWTDLNYGTNTSLRQQGRMNVTVNQSMGERGSVYLTAGRTRYWNAPGDDVILQAGYSGSFKQINYNISLSRTRSPYSERNDTRFGINLTIPLGRDTYAPRATVNVSGGTNASVQTGITGTFGEQHNWSYSAQAGAQGGGVDESANLNWNGASATVDVNASHGRGYSQAGVNVSGSAVLHGGGVTFGQQVGDSFGLVHVPDVAGVGVSSGNGVKTDAKGYAVVPYTQPYRVNEVNIDLRDLETDADIDATVAQTVPRRGSITVSKFAAKTGRRAVFKLTGDGGQPLPFGARVLNDKGDVLGMVGQSGKALMTGIAEQGEIVVKIADETLCRQRYVLSDTAGRYPVVELVCKKDQGQD